MSDEILKKMARLEDIMEKAKDSLLSYSRKDKVTIVHHNDADGMSSAYVLEEVLRREDFDVQSCCLERTYIKPIEEIYAKTSGPVVIVDLGSKMEKEIKKASKGRLSLIIDHHGKSTDKSALDLLDDNFFVINCTNHNLSGDKLASASTLVYIFGTKVNPENKDLANIALIGPLGDQNHTRGEEKGMFPEIGYDARIFEEAVNAKHEDGEYQIYINHRFESGWETARNITVLGSVGYHEKGLKHCTGIFKDGYTDETYETLDALKLKREKAYERVIEKIKQGKTVIRTNDLFYFNVEDEFKGMGTKTIGDFCTYLLNQANKNPKEFAFIDPTKYLMGGQRIEPISLFGKPFDVFEPQKDGWVKISIRTSPATLGEQIKKGDMPAVIDLVDLVNPDYSDGCHDERGATVVPNAKVNEYIELSQRKIIDPSDTRTLTI